METATAEDVAYLYHRAKWLPLFTATSVLFGPVLLFFTLVGLYLAYRRKRLLREIDAGGLAVLGSSNGELEYVREHHIRLYVPAFALGAYFLASMLCPYRRSESVSNRRRRSSLGYRIFFCNSCRR